jgi:transcriptional regulator with XRE-family HTH domain
MKQELKKIINNIREKREEKRLTQEYMGSSLGISQNAYSKIELHQSKLTLERLLKISELLDVDPATLLGYKNVTKKDLS